MLWICSRWDQVTYKSLQGPFIPVMNPGEKPQAVWAEQTSAMTLAALQDAAPQSRLIEGFGAGSDLSHICHNSSRVTPKPVPSIKPLQGKQCFTSAESHDNRGYQHPMLRETLSADSSDGGDDMRVTAPQKREDHRIPGKLQASVSDLSFVQRKQRKRGVGVGGLR